MPDLNSVPPSPRVLAASRIPSSSGTSPAILPAIPSLAPPSAHSPQTSPPAQMAPPPLPTSPSSIHVFPSNQGLHSASSLPSPFGPPPATSTTADSVSGPGPLRHPRPLTAAELHSQLEKEQEAVVNRLTRELTLLRAQNASVVSNTSSTSASASETQSTPNLSSSAPGNGPADHLFSGTSGFSIPSSTGRHNRTYSNTSTRSLTSGGGGGGGSVSLGAGAANTPSIFGITAPAPIRPTAPNLSRQNSTASRRSRANSPGPISISGPGRDRDISSPSILTGTARYEDTAFYRAELESARRENEALRRRVRELERQAAAQTQAAHSAAQQAQAQTQAQAQAQATGRSRSTSVSTTTSMNAASGASVTGSSLHGTPSATPAGGAHITGRRDVGSRATSMLSVTGSVGVGVPEDEVRVGESAASAGLSRGQERTSIDRPSTDRPSIDRERS